MYIMEHYEQENLHTFFVLPTMSFLLPKSLDHSTNGWGPSTEPEELFKDIPYAPFSKGERLGKAADWNATMATRAYQSTLSIRV